MADNNHKEQWIDKVLNSTSGMQRAEPYGGLYARVMMRADLTGRPTIISFPVKKWAAAAVILLALNIGTMAYFQLRQKTHQNNPVASLSGYIENTSVYNY